MSSKGIPTGERNFSKIPSPLGRWTRRSALACILSAAGCGFVPAYGPGGTAGRWQNTVTIEAPDAVFGFRMRAHLTEVFGPTTSPAYTLTVAPKTDPVPATITEDGDITRFNITGIAEWTLRNATGTEINSGLVQTFTSYSATSTTVATQTAESDARDRLAVALSDLIIQQMLTTP